ncbi:MAG: ABC transporter permease [Coriobacteriaceae bacterium]|nr:MAG: ABC transporter permease [Coriobacteriaceae bacterium]
MVATHLWLSAVALALATVIAVPLGILGARFRRLDSVSEGVWGTLRIIPSLALLLVLIPVLGTGTLPAVVSLTVLAIPPILINTTTAFKTLPADVLEAAEGMGMPPARELLTVKLPLALPVAFAGFRTATSEVIASAMLAAYIGAGGLGDLIFTGLGLMRTDLLWIGGLSVAALSLAVGALLSLAEARMRRRAGMVAA